MKIMKRRRKRRRGGGGRGGGRGGIGYRPRLEGWFPSAPSRPVERPSSCHFSRSTAPSQTSTVNCTGARSSTTSGSGSGIGCPLLLLLLLLLLPLVVVVSHCARRRRLVWFLHEANGLEDAPGDGGSQGGARGGSPGEGAGTWARRPLEEVAQHLRRSVFSVSLFPPLDDDEEEEAAVMSAASAPSPSTTARRRRRPRRPRRRRPPGTRRAEEQVPDVAPVGAVRVERAVAALRVAQRSRVASRQSFPQRCTVRTHVVAPRRYSKFKGRGATR